MAVLVNIDVKDDDLRLDYPDIDNIKFSEDIQPNYSQLIDNAKLEVYGSIKIKYKDDNPGLTDAEINTALAKVKDFPEEEFLKKRIAKIAVSLVMVQNNMYEEAEVHRDLASKFPIIYYIDTDEDSAVAIEEEKKADYLPKFHR